MCKNKFGFSHQARNNPIGIDEFEAPSHSSVAVSNPNGRTLTIKITCISPNKIHFLPDNLSGPYTLVPAASKCLGTATVLHVPDPLIPWFSTLSQGP